MFHRIEWFRVVKLNYLSDILLTLFRLPPVKNKSVFFTGFSDIGQRV